MMSSDSYMATPVFGSTCNRRVSQYNLFLQNCQMNTLIFPNEKLGNTSK